MKFIVSKSSLEVAVKNLCKVINTKNALPILSDILFCVNEKSKTARLIASDSEVTMGCEVILSECEGGGSFCVSSTTLAAMLAEASEQPLTITATTESDMKFTMVYTDGSAFCPIESADDFPWATQGEFHETLESINGEWLRDALKRSLFATATDDLRPIMCGVNFALVDGNLEIVASNGHIMMKSSYDISNKVDINRCGSFIMPKKVANILSAIAEAGDYVTIEWNERDAHINMLGYDIDFRLIEGKYPNYNAIIPQNYAHEPLCRRTDLLSALRAVAPFAPDTSQLLKLTFDGDRLEVSGDDYDFGEGAVKSIFTEDYEGEPLTIGVKASSIIGMLSKLSTFDVLLKLNDPSRCIIIEPIYEGEHNEEITGLIMPMLVNE